ncbi:MAG TPA: ATP-binding protein [Streptosporangiaceae bacterium]|nr:ATP-binding protein [Streptosporangiaceae bacterium]
MPSTAMREGSVSCRYSRALTAPRDAREHTRKTLCSWGIEAHVEVAQVIISELVTNAIRHGAGPVETRICHEGHYLHIEVHDDGPGRPVRRYATADDESGRGLTVIDGLLQLYGGSLIVVNDETGDGKTVCASIRLPDGR